MPTARLILCACVVVAGTAIRVPSESDAGKEDLPFLGSPPPQELQVFADRIGEWTSKWEVRPNIQNREGFTATGQATGKWIHNRHFLRMEGTSTSSKFREESSVLYGYDASKKVYRRWLFTSSGLASEAEGHWDEAKRTMTWKALNLPAGVTGTITEVHEKDRIQTTVLIKRNDGQVLTDLTVVATRKK